MPRLGSSRKVVFNVGLAAADQCNLLFGHLHLDGMAGGWREVKQICLVLGFADNFLEAAVPCLLDLWLSPAVSLP